jgi:L-ascorbate metabolism protein UlaG (beta-lactamase superfamily)
MFGLAALAGPLLLIGASFLFPSRRPADVVSAVPESPPPARLIGPSGEPEHDATLHLTRVAHASVLLDFDGEVVLTDPWFSEKWHYHHGEPLGVALDKLPKLTAVIASHAHYDHFDMDTFASYPDKSVPFFVGPNMVTAARAAGFTNVRELKPWESAIVGRLTITAAPAAHKVPEVTFVVQAPGMTVYFAADTRVVPEHAELARRFPSIQVALMPVNGLHVMGEQVVMNAEEAAGLVAALHAEVTVPIHYAFHGSWFTDGVVLDYDGTPDRFVTAVRAAAPSSTARVLAPGQTWTVTRRAPGEETNNSP